jgi:hypothetical protein
MRLRLLRYTIGIQDCARVLLTVRLPRDRQTPRRRGDIRASRIKRQCHSLGSAEKYKHVHHRLHLNGGTRGESRRAARAGGVCGGGGGGGAAVAAAAVAAAVAVAAAAAAAAHFRRALTE